jgi:hypothetical protein
MSVQKDLVVTLHFRVGYDDGGTETVEADDLEREPEMEFQKRERRALREAGFLLVGGFVEAQV